MNEPSLPKSFDDFEQRLHDFTFEIAKVTAIPIPRFLQSEPEFPDEELRSTHWSPFYGSIADDSDQ